MEKINNYTPAPWRADEEDGKYVFPSKDSDMYGEHPICEMRGWGRLQKFENGEDIQRANAQLIALAPTLYEQHFKMLEALKKALYSLENNPMYPLPLIQKELRQTIKECEL